ncbi:MAG TPA: hypothetical protein ENN60_03360 [archaeon]|nr:hypothetical protein [archaeon]
MARVVPKPPNRAELEFGKVTLIGTLLKLIGLIDAFLLQHPVRGTVFFVSGPVYMLSKAILFEIRLKKYRARRVERAFSWLQHDPSGRPVHTVCLFCPDRLHRACVFGRHYCSQGLGPYEWDPPYNQAPYRPPPAFGGASLPSTPKPPEDPKLERMVRDLDRVCRLHYRK